MASLRTLTRNLGITLEMIKWEHSIFALPFALTGAMLAARGWPHPAQLVWIVLSMITARSAAMAFNRWVDADLDAANARTAGRAIPSGLLSKQFVGGFTLLMAGLFLLCAAQLNRLTLLLAPLALLIVLAYSYTKRFTRWSHLFLGLALGVAPSAAWIAVRGSFDPRVLVLTCAVLFWVAGFDIFYACQDAEHDRSAGLHSVPSTLGLPAAFALARGMHLVMIALLAWMTVIFSLGAIAWVGVALVAALLLYEHSLVSPFNLSKINAAFFTMNGVISIVFFLAVAIDLLTRRA